MEYPAWQTPLNAAFAETDLEKIHPLVTEAEGAIFLRTQELADSSDGFHESEAIKVGLQQLLHLKTEKLGWPAVEAD